MDAAGDKGIVEASCLKPGGRRDMNGRMENGEWSKVRSKVLCIWYCSGTNPLCIHRTGHPASQKADSSLFVKGDRLQSTLSARHIVLHSSGLCPTPSHHFCGSSLSRGRSQRKQHLPDFGESLPDCLEARAASGPKLAQPVQVPQPGKEDATPAQIFQTALNALDLFDTPDEASEEGASYEDIAVDQQEAAASVVGRAVYEVKPLAAQRSPCDLLQDSQPADCTCFKPEANKGLQTIYTRM